MPVILRGACESKLHSILFPHIIWLPANKLPPITPTTLGWGSSMLVWSLMMIVSGQQAKRYKKWDVCHKSLSESSDAEAVRTILRQC